MHVKEQVKEFVHDVKRKFSFSHKHRRDTCSTFDSYDYSSVDSRSHLDDYSSSSSEDHDASERSRFVKFIRPRMTSISQRHHNVLHKVKRVGSKRYRLFSTPAMPSEPMVEPAPKQPVSYQGPESSGGRRGMADERSTVVLSEDYSDVLDISARGSAESGSVTPEVASILPSSHGADRDSMSQSQPQFDTESHSDTSGTLVTTFSSDKKSTSEFDDSVDLHSDGNSAEIHDIAPLTPSPCNDPMADLPPRDEEVALPSPAPVYLPRLTAPSMFLPIPNVRSVFPFSNSLVWWLAPKWSPVSSSVSIFLPRFASPQQAWSHPHSAFPSPLRPNLLPSPSTRSRH